jgi:uncharacterized RDD family membrane protein YckC
MDDWRPAGFWIRAVALGIDLTVVNLVQFSLGLMAGAIWGAAVERDPAFHATVVASTLLFFVLYSTVLVALFGQTIGKRLVRARVAGADGELLPIGAALLRCLAYAVSGAPLLMGFIMAGLRRDRRALHDLVAGSRVERLPVEPRAPEMDAGRTGGPETAAPPAPGTALSAPATAPSPPGAAPLADRRESRPAVEAERPGDPWRSSRPDAP